MLQKLMKRKSEELSRHLESSSKEAESDFGTFEGPSLCGTPRRGFYDVWTVFLRNVCCVHGLWCGQ